MANNLGSLVVSLGLDAAEYVRGLTKSEYQAQQWARRVETSIEAVRTSALAGFAAMGTAVAVLDRQLNDIAGFNDLADKMGDTAEAVASLKLAADLSGTSLDTMASASVKLTSALAKTDDEGKGVGAALKAIGLEIDAFKQLSPTAQIEAVANALAGFEDGAGKTAVAVQLFGKSGADLIPMLNDLAETGGRQVTLTGDQIAAADEYSKATARLRSEVQTLVQVTAADAAPLGTQMVQIFRDIATYASSGAGGVNLLQASLSGAKTVLETVVILGANVAYVFKQTGIEIGGMAAQLAALARLDLSGFNAISQAMKEDAARARAELDAFERRVLGSPAVGNQASYSNEGRNYTQGPKPISFVPTVPTGGGTRSAALTEAEKAQRDYDEFQKKAAEDLNAYLGRRAEQQLRDEAENEKRYLRELAEFENAAGEYVYRRNVKRWEDEQKAREELAKRAADEQAAQVQRLGDAFTNTFGRAFDQGMKLGDLIKRLAFDAINIQFLTPATQKIGSSLGNVVSSLFKSFDGGGYTGSGSRSGGMDGKGGFLAMLHPNETVVDHSRGQGLGGRGVVINYSIDARGADAGVEERLRAALAESEARTRAAIVPTMVSAVKGSTGVARAMRGG